MPIPLSDIIKKHALGAYDVRFFPPGGDKELIYMECSSFEEGAREYWRILKGKSNTSEYGKVRLLHVESNTEVSKDDLQEFFDNSNLPDYFKGN